MKLGGKLGATLAVLAMGTQSAAAPPKLSKCISHAEFQAAAAYLTPTILSTVVEQCKPSLAPDSFLATNGDAMLARYAYSAEKHDAQLNALMAKVGPETGGGSMDALTMRGVFNAMIGGELRKVLNPKACANASQMLGLLDPLPAENLYGLFDFVLTQVDDKQRTKAVRDKLPQKPMFCDAPSSAPTTASK